MKKVHTRPFNVLKIKSSQAHKKSTEILRERRQHLNSTKHDSDTEWYSNKPVPEYSAGKQSTFARNN